MVYPNTAITASHPDYQPDRIGPDLSTPPPTPAQARFFWAIPAGGPASIDNEWAHRPIHIDDMAAAA